MSATAINHHGHHDTRPITMFGFWVYIMSDCILFAALFATYAVLHANTFGGPGPADLFHLPLVLTETLLLLCSSFTYGLALLASYRKDTSKVVIALLLTFILGLSFVVLEISEFHALAAEGHSWRSSAFLSSFFTLVGTHGLHVSIGLIWMFIVGLQIMRRGITPMMELKLSTLALFWHFLDVVWIFLFTVVYLMGVI